MKPEELSRFLYGLREAGWSGEEINNFLIYIGTGDEAYRPRSKAGVTHEDTGL